MTRVSLTDTLRETLALFDGEGQATPLTTTEVADRLDLGRRSTYERLERLVEGGHLETKKVGARGRIWWLPVADDGDDREGAGRMLSRLIDNVPGMVYRCRDEPGWPMSFVSDAATDLTGYDPAAIEAGEVTWGADVVHPDDRESLRTAVHAQLDADEQFTVEYRIRTADGETRWVRERGCAVDGEAESDVLEGVVTDVTDQKRSERDRQDAERRFRSLVDAVEEYAIFMLDPDGHVRTWNRGASRIKGYGREAIVGEHFSTFYTDAACEDGVPDENLEDAAAEGTTTDEGWRVRADGSRFWAHVTITAIRDDDGDLEGFAKVTRDMTGRREREQQLHQERETIERILETVPVGIGVFSADGEMVRANERGGTLLGLSSDEVEEYAAGKEAMYDPDGNPVPRGERPFGLVMDNGEPVWDWECQVDRPDGGRRWLSLNAVPITDDGGEITHVIVAGEDVTQLKEQARRLERQRDDVQSELEEVFERVDDGFFALDRDLRFTHVNDRAGDLLERSPGELVGEHIWGAFDPGPKAEAAFEEALETAESASFQEYYDPLETWLEYRVYPSETGLSVYFEDVTGRKERERELELYETVVATIQDGVYVMDEDYRFTMVNDRYCEMTGYDREDLLGEHSSLVVDDDVTEESFQRLQEVAAGDAEAATIEADILRADGSRLRAESRFTALPAAGTDVREPWKVAVVRDVSGRKARERELQRYETIVETVDDGIYVVDQDGVFSMVNEAYESMVGRSRGELVGSHVSTALEDEDVLREAKRLEEELAAGERTTASLEAELVTPDGDTRVGEATFSLLQSDDGYERVAVVRDVTERIERERELERQRERLAALDNLNAVVRDITAAVIDRSTREEIERIVCERLAEVDSYEFAWIGEVDPQTESIVPREEAGVEGYLDSVPISTDPDVPAGQGPGGRAVRTREMQVGQDALTAPESEPWHDSAEAFGYRSVAAIPIVHGDTLYGLLGVYATRPQAFGGEERAVVGQLGEVVGYAIAAVERRRALTSEEVVELVFQVPDVFEAIAVPDDASGTITLDRAVPTGDDTYLQYGVATDGAMAAVEAMVEADSLPHWEAVTVLGDDDEGTQFEVTLADPPVLSLVAAHGGYVDEATIEDGDYTMRIHLAPGTDVRGITESVRAAYPGLVMLTRRQLTRNEPSTVRLERTLDEELTPRQRTSLEAAYNAGYFEWPRDRSGEEVAASIGVSSPTFHQHLRKAQRKLLRTVFEKGPRERERGQ